MAAMEAGSTRCRKVPLGVTPPEPRVAAVEQPELAGAERLPETTRLMATRNW